MRRSKTSASRSFSRGAEAESVSRKLSIDEFERLPEEEGYRLELVGGLIVREPAPAPQHGRLDVRVVVRLAPFIEQRALGVLLSNTAFALATEPATVRVPDISFVAAEHIPPEGYSGGFWHLAPDLAIEIVSPSNTASELQQKVLDYLDAGSRLVWIIDPRRRNVTVYRSRSDIRILTAADALEGDDVLPGLRIDLADLFG